MSKLPELPEDAIVLGGDKVVFSSSVISDPGWMHYATLNPGTHKMSDELGGESLTFAVPTFAYVPKKPDRLSQFAGLSGVTTARY